MRDGAGDIPPHTELIDRRQGVAVAFLLAAEALMGVGDTVGALKDLVRFLAVQSQIFFQQRVALRAALWSRAMKPPTTALAVKS